MPQLFRFGEYIIYYWSNEGRPIESVHVHIAYGIPSKNGTKVWITRSGKALLANNNSHIPERKLNILLRFIEANSEEIIASWREHFETADFYC
ncbi:DUF4160 domain-containing protein [Dialister sp.]|uniref:DUF4160 domain-containing protein n=1 Tax=Dialister sp. TaxID=1955814 RepID=UPI002E801623|nr:DUF4160 domain-containing protein [Dialister sp.]MEE3452786.1 DUF4160 domain-containing protein [Dialister sp.]